MRTLDEHNELSLSEIPTVQRGDGQPAPPSLETPAAAVMKRDPFTKRDWTILAASLAVAALCSAVFWPVDLKVFYPDVWINGLRDWFFFGCVLPGIGLTLVELAGFACILLAIGKRGRYDRTTIPLLAACFLMCLFPTLFGNHVLRVLNCLVLWIVGPFTLFLVANTHPSCCFDISSHLAALGHFFVSLIRFAPDPVIETLTWIRMHHRTVSTSADNKRTKSLLLQTCLGLFASLLLLAVILPLLISADSMFEYILEILELNLDDFCESFSHTLNMDVAHVLYALILTPFIFSLTCGYARVCPHEKRHTHHPTHRWLRTLPAVMVLSSLDLIYALFAIVQFVYLFGGARSAAMSGGYAQYARSGFFQLVAVAAINVAVGLIIVRFTEPRNEHVSSRKSQSASPVVNALVWLLVALTYVILASAIWRMRLYVSAYGLTILRCLTFLGMAFCAIVLASLLAKSISPSFHFYRVVLCGGLALWLAFNLVNVDAHIAEYNVDAYLGGSLESLDLDYFVHLSPDADPALERLERSLPSSDYGIADSEIRLRYTTQSDVRELPWQLQCLPYWKAQQRGL